MKTDTDFDRQIKDMLRDALDREDGPDPTWAESPAARRVALLERRGRVRWPLRILAVAALIGAGGAAALLAGGRDHAPDRSTAATNGWIAFTVAQDKSSGADTDIWLVALGQEPRRVIGTDTDTVHELCPAFSPDGRRLGYGRVEGQNAALAIVDVDGDGRVSDPVTIEVGDGRSPPCPVWSPYGGDIAFGVNRTSPTNPGTSAAGNEVWIVTVSDRAITVLPDLLATDLEWSPDGSQLAIASGADQLALGERLQDGRIYLYALASGATRALDATLGAISLTWSPDSRRIVYQATLESDAVDELRVIDIETGRQKKIAGRFSAIHGIGPVWSPDGETIVYQRCADEVPCGGEAHELVLVSANDPSNEAGSAPEVVIPTVLETADGAFQNLLPWWVAWSPDGRYLLVRAWSWPDTGGELQFLAGVPIDRGRPTVLLADLPGMEAYDGHDTDLTFVPIQTWERRADE